MTRQIVSSIFVLCILFLMVGCGGRTYSDYMEANKEFVQLMDEYVASLEKATSGKEITIAMNHFADGMEVLGPKMKAMEKKYAELDDVNNQPEQVRLSLQKAEEVAKKYPVSFSKIMPYMKEPEVQEAFKRVVKAMKTLS
jgi:uncharacterized protein YjgD (DUF1641 family)